ncbi:MAG: acetyl-CoA carboxylase biotin carboxyl carrier protein [Planctomycetaceae bacterium]
MKAKGSRKQSGSSDAGAGKQQDSGDIFDVARVRRLINMMKRHDLAEIDLRQGDQQVRIRRGPEGSGAIVMAPAAHPPMAAASGGAASSGSPPAKVADDGMLIVKSPMVGSFYRSSSPDAAPFVKVGDRIGPDQTVCIVDAMKVFNEIPSGVSGQVVAILVENGAAVEFGQPLIKVDPGA